MRHSLIVLRWSFTLICIAVIAPQLSAQATSTPEERAQWVETTRKLESAPLDASVGKQGDAALKRVEDVHDVHVPLCATLFTEFNAMKYTDSHAIMRQFMLASAAFIIENSDKAADTNAMNQSALESVLKTYQAILQQKPDAKSKMLDDLLKKQSQGQLQDYVKKQCH
jgi:hypothetical protein